MVLITNSFKEEVHKLEARYNKSLAYVRRLVGENKDLRALMSKYIKVGKGGLKNWVQEPQERGDTSERVYGILNKVINTSEATHISDTRKYQTMQTRLHTIEERVLNISRAYAASGQLVNSSNLPLIISSNRMTL